MITSRDQPDLVLLPRHREIERQGGGASPCGKEAGVKGADAGIWLGLFAPTGTPKEIVAKLNSAIDKVLQMPDVREKLLSAGSLPVGGSSDEFAKVLAVDYPKWGQIVKSSGVKLSP